VWTGGSTFSTDFFKCSKMGILQFLRNHNGRWRIVELTCTHSHNISATFAFFHLLPNFPFWSHYLVKTIFLFIIPYLIINYYFFNHNELTFIGLFSFNKKSWIQVLDIKYLISIRSTIIFLPICYTTKLEINIFTVPMKLPILKATQRVASVHELLVQKVCARKLNWGFQIPVIESTDSVPLEPAKHDNFLHLFFAW